MATTGLARRADIRIAPPPEPTPLRRRLFYLRRDVIDSQLVDHDVLDDLVGNDCVGNLRLERAPPPKPAPPRRRLAALRRDVIDSRLVDNRSIDRIRDSVGDRLIDYDLANPVGNRLVERRPVA